MAAPRNIPAGELSNNSVIKSKKKKSLFSAGQMDIAFLMIVLVLLSVGIVMLFSASYAISINEGGNGLDYAMKQIVFAVLGLIIMLIASTVDYHVFRKPAVAYGLFIIALILLVVVLFYHTEREDGFKRWIPVPGLGTIQPSEIMKFALVVIFSYLISVNYHKMKTFTYGVVPFVIILGVVSLLMLKEPHLSGTAIMCIVGAVMIFVGGMNLRHLLFAGIGGVGALVGYIMYKMANNDLGHVMNRIYSWLYPFEEEYMEFTYQTRQSLITIGSGGLFGLGFGNSRQKFLYLPEAENDFIFAILCEELGFVGAVFVILTFMLLVFRGFYLATKAPDKFGMMMAVGLTLHIGVQALLNIAVVTNSIPNTGISLPFFSYGGSALLMQLGEMGVILNISRQSAIET